MIDPRLAVVGRRLEAVDRVLAVTGGKGGIGKSVVSCLLALSLARDGRSVGLLDLDLTGPCDHLILGINDRFPSEVHGVEPRRHDGIHFMSISCFGGNRPAPLRGPDLTNAMLELLAITRWGKLDALVVDLPPGLGDVALDVVRLLPRSEYLVVSTASRVVIDTVRRTLALLAGVDAPIAGVVENMKRDGSTVVRDLADEHGRVYLGALPWDEGLESAIGDTERLSSTAAAAATTNITRRLFP
ncbi:MAG: P-loop NTPase [Planctomycetota bacterium]|jgi:ATP-binding protein involved in chromosome partitioning